MRQGAIVMILALSGACGGSDNPAGPSSTPTSITVNSTSELLYVGASETFTATATLSNGQTQAVAGGVWGGDAPTVASVESSTGRVTGMGSGMVTIFVDYHGARGTRLMRVLPNYQGTWSGSYFVTGCSQTGAFALADICAETFSDNRVLPMSMTNTQSRDAVNGQFALGTISGSGTGPIQTHGELNFVGTARSGDLSADTVWSMHSSQAGRITGNGNFIMRFAGLSGEARVGVTIRDLNRTSSIQTAEPVARHPVRSLADIAAAIAAR